MLSAKINTSVSFRSLSKVLVTFNLYLNIELSSPSFSTAMLWIKKIGYVQLQWVKEKESFIIEMDLIMSVVQEISIILKNEGLSKQTKSRCSSLLNNCKKGKLKIFKEYMLNYLSEYTKQISHRKEILLCCSDIIESTFGRYKNELSKNPMSGITDLVLITPALTSSLSGDTVRAAIDKCRVKDIEVWKKNNLCNSLLAKRKMEFKN